MPHDQAYLLAEKKIEEARVSRAAELDLANFRLTTLPKSIEQLTNLHFLNISANKLTELPNFIFKLGDLRILHASGNQLTMLPDAFNEFKHLQHLSLANNKLNALPISLSSLSELLSLNISFNPLTVLPEWFGVLVKLQSLSISTTKLKTIPEWVGSLTQLQSIDLSYNNLVEIPNSFSLLSQLQSLQLRNNQLADLPEAIGQLIQLKLLDLSSNLLAKLPDTLGRLGQLQLLELSYNSLSILPESIEQLTELRSLLIRNNQIAKLPERIGQLGQIQTLFCNNNRLTTVPVSIGQLSRLEKLDISCNAIKMLPDFFRQLTQMKFFECHSNKLTSLPSSLGHLFHLQTLDFHDNELTTFPESLGQLTKLHAIDFHNNQLATIPDTVSQLSRLQSLDISNNDLISLPESISLLSNLLTLNISGNKLNRLPESIGALVQLREMEFSDNQLTDIPASLIHIKNFDQIAYYKYKQSNPFNQELATAYKQGLAAIKTYLRAKAAAQIILSEAKLILVGEGEVGKTCLMDALLDKEWQEHPSTHGIEIQQIIVNVDIDKDGKELEDDEKKEITLNGWDFGGQRVYRPTHQLFFSAPAVYLVVWKPREGPQQGFIKEWIQLVKRREPSAKIIVVATHGGPQQRQPDIDRQELWDIFGKDTVVDFFFVDNKPDEQGNRKGIEELKQAIARVAATLPEVGRSVPKSFADVRAALVATGRPYLPLNEVLAICRAHNMDDEVARLFIIISHRLGHLTHYQHDPALRDIVILRPDWLATAMSYVLDDELTRSNHGLVKFSRLGHLWDDSSRAADSRYEPTLHPIFARLMDRFDLSYVVADPSPKSDSDPLRLIGQLVPDIRPANLDSAWPSDSNVSRRRTGDLQQTQICRIVDKQTGQSATAEGLFYQLIVRLHKYSLGRMNYTESVHWQRGLVLDNAYNGRAFLQHVGNDIHITVRAPYPERFLAMLTEEVKYLVESFWEGLRCDVTVPCLNPNPCLGLFEVEKLIENKRGGRPEVPCSICNVWQNTDTLLLNAPAATQPISLDFLQKEFAQVKDKLDEVKGDTGRILSQVDKQFADLIQLYTDEAKEGPRLFSLFPVDGNKFNPQTWMREKFRLVLWCEHSRLPLPAINGIESKKGVYDFELDRDWFKRAVPFLKFMTGTLSLVLPMMSSTLKVVDDTAFKTLENQLSLGKSVIDFLAGEGTKLGEVMGTADTSSLERGVGIRAESGTLRELHALLKAKDPSFGGLVRVMNKRQEFLWVHERFAGEY